MRKFLIEMRMRMLDGYFEHLEKFKETQYWSKDALLAWQTEKLQKLIAHAYNTVPFYREQFDLMKIKPKDIKSIDDLQLLPVLEKETLRSNYEKLLSINFQGKKSTRSTGGSTGVPLRIAVNHDSSMIENALVHRFYGWFGYEWGDEIVKFWGDRPIISNTLKLKKYLSRKYYNISFFSTFDGIDESFDKIMGRLQKTPPKILRGYTSAIYNLACKALDRGVRLHLNAVTTTAEKLYAFQRNKIGAAFGANIFDQYGCGETNSLAFECEKHHGLHVASEHVILETIDAKGERVKKGTVLITNLDNYAMPLIRYANGDEAIWASRPCDCNRGAPLLESIDGRVYDYIQGPNDRKVHTGFLDDLLVDLAIEGRAAIKEFRLVQTHIDKLIIEFVSDEDFSPKEKNIIEETIEQFLGKMTVDFNRVDYIPLTRMGKKMFILSMLNRDKWERVNSQI